MENKSISELIAVSAENANLSKRFSAILLKELRKSKLRRSDLVLKHADGAVAYEGNSSEVWNIYEQMFLAAVDSGDIPIAEKSLAKLSDKFPKSARVLRLSGIFYELHEKYDTALEVYNTLLTENASNIMVMKRRACVFRATRRYEEEIQEMNNILKLFPSDFSTWLQLGDRYVATGDYEAAAHCYEELLILDPYTAHVHTKLAEAYYTIGGATNILLSRKHFAMSLNMQNPRLNLRAYYGLIMACKAFSELSAKQKSSNSLSGDINQEERVNTELLKWAKIQSLELPAGSADANADGSASLKLVLSSIL